MLKFRIPVFFCLLTASLFAAAQSEKVYKYYGTRSGIIHYDLNGSKVLSQESTIYIRGDATLLFTEWGARRLYKEKCIESTDGPLKNAKSIHILRLIDKGKLYQVDFEKRHIEKSELAGVEGAIEAREDHYQKRIEEIKRESRWLGYSRVLGYKCDEWLHESRKLCLYKGVPLQEEVLLSGVEVLKTAVSAEFDLNISDDTFTLPELKKVNRLGYMISKVKHPLKRIDPKKVKRVDKVETVDIAKHDEIKSEPRKSSKERAEEIFQRQKKLLPILLDEMLEARACLEDAENVDEANQCIYKLLVTRKKMSGEEIKENRISTWTNSNKEKRLDELEEEILGMKRRMPCIRRSQNFNDLSSCIEKPE